MADNLSPLVNLDLVNQIYRTINAQISERVYDPNYYSAAKLGDADHRYVSAYLEALNVSGNATITENTSTGTLNNLTLTATSSGFTISNNAVSRVLTVNSTAALGSNTASENGAITVKSAGTGPTTIIGPSGNTAQFNVKTIIGDTTCTGPVTIRSSSTSSTTIIGPNGGIAELKAGTCVITDDCSTANTAGKIVQRDSSKDIKVTSVNNVNISTDDNKVALSKGTASVAVSANAAAVINSNLTVNSVATLGSTASGETGGVVVKSEGVKTTTIVGPNDGTAKLKNGTCVVEDDLPNVTVGSATTATINSWADDEIHYLATVKASGENQGISAETDSTKKLYIERKTVDNATTYHFYAGAVHNAVWNDLADCIEVPEDTDLEFGYCYSWNGNKVEKTSRKSKNCIGIHSNTAGLFMGEKPVRTIQAAVAGFALAYVDRIYPEGTPLTWSDDGKLTKCTVLKRVLHPERVIATFYKEEKQESWHGVKVNNRHWVKVR